MVRRGPGPAGALSRRAGAVINDMRLEAGLSVRELCKAAGMSQTYYYKRQRGIAPYTLNDLESLSGPLRRSPHEILAADALKNSASG